MSISRYDVAAISIIVGAWILAIVIGIGVIGLKVWVVMSVYQWMVN